MGKVDAPVATTERELVGFESVSLEAGKSTTVTVSVKDFVYYDETDDWTIPKRLIRSSLDVPLKTSTK
ncbi:fibronectin type III-like domain-contianing protein [Halorhabdus amylolytica]|uniref:fibronectin type III-like domain-contianing protein n=1 Tax=Halorhabdus amylolytica TaxID=2559573 RepID=UPI001B7D8B6E|nr:fibronectin type III-like domain-contianing protein [Halorhabdus amylolytica]